MRLKEFGRNETGAFVFVTALSIFWIDAAVLRSSFYSDSGFFSFASGAGEIVELSTNAFFPWQFEPISSSLLRMVPKGYLIYMSLLFAFGALGVFSLAEWYRSEQAREPDLRSSASVAVCLFASLLLLFGCDTVLWSALAVLPWHMKSLSLLLTGYSPSRMAVLRFALLSVLVAIFGGQVAVLLGALSFATVLAVPSIRENRFLPGAAILTFVPALLRSLLVSSPIYPDYPPSAHVVSAWGVLEHYRPLVGSDPALLSYDWGYARALFFPYALGGFIVASLLILVAVDARRRAAEAVPFSMPIAGAMLCFFGLLDGRLLSPMLAQIMPLQSLSRLLPELAYLPLGRLSLELALPFLFLSMLNCGRLRFPLLLGSLTICFIITVVPASPFRPIQSREALRPLKDVASQSPTIIGKLFSPSFAVYKRSGMERLSKHEKLPPVGPFRPLKANEATAHATYNDKSAGLAVDGSDKTRWTTGAGRQIGDERFELVFSAEAGVRIRAFRFDLGTYVSDFPRGLKITAFDRAGAVCEQVDETPWEGPILFTPEGYPYYGPQQDVTVELVNGCFVKRVSIEQTGQGEIFDWTISEALVAESLPPF